MYVKLIKNELIREVKIGFSWTTFFFGFFPALFRGDIKWASIIFLSSLILGSFTYGFGGLAVGIIFAFLYNNLYIRGLLEEGWIGADEVSQKVIEQQLI